MRPDRRDRTLMKIAMMWADHGTCSRARVGAVISRNGRTLASGYNGAPAGMPHCDHQVWQMGEVPPDWVHDFVKGLAEDGHQIEMGPDTAIWKSNGHITLTHGKNAQGPGCNNVVHAEANALAFAARYGVGTDGAELHTTRVPCSNCAGMIINAGITRVVWYEEHRDMDGLVRLGEAGLEVIRWKYEA